MNEELRSSAEELETSKEELQSVNEELTTVNQELKIKIEELGLTNNDFQNLINSSDIGTIFLDRRLRVKLFTPAATVSVQPAAADLGRPLADITTGCAIADAVRRPAARPRRAADDRARVRHTRRPLDPARLRPYRTLDDRIDGVVITLQDVTERRQCRGRSPPRRGAAAAAHRQRDRLRHLHDERRRRHRFVELRRRADVRLHAPTRSSAAMRRCCSPPRIAPPDMPARSCGRRPRSGRAVGRAVARAQGRHAVLSAAARRSGSARRSASRRSPAICRRSSRPPTRCASSRPISICACRSGPERSRLKCRARADAHQHVTVLLQRIVTAQEDERARIARDLHDHLGQQLTALRLTLQRHDERLESGDDDREQIATHCRLPRRSTTTSISSPGSCGRRRSTISAWRRRCRSSCASGRSTTTFPPSTAATSWPQGSWAATPRPCSTGSPRRR